MKRAAGIPLLTLVLALAALPGAGTGRAIAAPREEPFVTRPFHPSIGERWIGDAICYGPHRDGQSPGGASPTRDELREDLGLMARHWGLLRTYGALGPAGTLLEIIRADSLAMRVMLGAWVAADDSLATRREIEEAIRLAAAYPDIVVAVCVGNETQVAWSSNRVPPARLVELLREVRARTTVPVATADDHQFWRLADSRQIADEVDLLVTHAHPMWNGRRLDEALAWTRATLDSVRAAHPGRDMIIGETGWATHKLDSGEQGRLIHGAAGEPEQAVYYREVTAWARRERVPTFFFEAFDENWKGGPDPGEVEKHWGLYRADRTPKAALAGPADGSSAAGSARP